MLMVPSTPPSPMLVPLQSLALIVFNSILLFRLSSTNTTELNLNQLDFGEYTLTDKAQTLTHNHWQSCIGTSIIAFIYTYLYIVRHSDQTAKINLSTVIHFSRNGCRITNSFVCSLIYLYLAIFVCLFVCCFRVLVFQHT